MGKTVERFAMPCQVRLVNDTTTPDEQKQIISGVAITYNSRSQDVGGYVRMFAPGCFAESLTTNEVFGLYAHDDNDILSRTSTGSLVINDTPEALQFTMTPPLWHTLFMGRLINNLVDGVSVGVVDCVDEWRKAEDGVIERYITSAGLVELSATAYPAFLATIVELVRFDQFQQDQTPATISYALKELLQCQQRLAELQFGK
jgi:HK97 family phage prohead protease